MTRARSYLLDQIGGDPLRQTVPPPRRTTLLLV